MQVAAHSSLGLDVPEDAHHLLGPKPGDGGDLGGGHRMLVCPQAEVHEPAGQREVELPLRLRERERVGGRRAAADLLGHARVLRQHPAQAQGIAGGVALGHEQADHGAAAPQDGEHLLPDGYLDARDLGGRVDVQDFS